MYQDSLDAIRIFLNTTFPNVERIYINNVPAGFKRPSFFVQLITGAGENLNKQMYSDNTTWQIVYFAPWDTNCRPDVPDQLTAVGLITQNLMESMILTAPDGTVYHIVDAEIGPRDNEVYCTLRLECEKSRPEPQYDVMQTINNEFKEG